LQEDIPKNKGKEDALQDQNFLLSDKEKPKNSRTILCISKPGKKINTGKRERGRRYVMG